MNDLISTNLNDVNSPPLLSFEPLINIQKEFNFHEGKNIIKTHKNKLIYTINIENNKKKVSKNYNYHLYNKNKENNNNKSMDVKLNEPDKNKTFDIINNQIINQSIQVPGEGDENDKSNYDENKFNFLTNDDDKLNKYTILEIEPNEEINKDNQNINIISSESGKHNSPLIQFLEEKLDKFQYNNDEKDKITEKNEDESFNQINVNEIKEDGIVNSTRKVEIKTEIKLLDKSNSCFFAIDEEQQDENNEQNNLDEKNESTNLSHIYNTNFNNILDTKPLIGLVNKLKIIEKNEREKNNNEDISDMNEIDINNKKDNNKKTVKKKATTEIKKNKGKKIIEKNSHKKDDIKLSIIKNKDEIKINNIIKKDKENIFLNAYDKDINQDFSHYFENDYDKIKKYKNEKKKDLEPPEINNNINNNIKDSKKSNNKSIYEKEIKKKSLNKNKIKNANEININKNSIKGIKPNLMNDELQKDKKVKHNKSSEKKTKIQKKNNININISKNKNQSLITKLINDILNEINKMKIKSNIKDNDIVPIEKNEQFEIIAPFIKTDLQELNKIISEKKSDMNEKKEEVEKRINNHLIDLIRNINTNYKKNPAQKIDAYKKAIQLLQGKELDEIFDNKKVNIILDFFKCQIF